MRHSDLSGIKSLAMHSINGLLEDFLEVVPKHVGASRTSLEAAVTSTIQVHRQDRSLLDSFPLVLEVFLAAFVRQGLGGSK